MAAQWIDQQSDAVSHWLTASKCPMLVSTADGSVRWVNRATEDLFGYTSSEFLGIGTKPLSWEDLTIDQRDIAADHAMVAALMAGERSEYTLAKSYRSKTGSPIPTRIHVLRWPPVGEVECFLVTVLPLDVDNEFLRDEILAMRHAFAEWTATNQQQHPVLMRFASWAADNKAAAAALLLWVSALIAGDRVIDIAAQLKTLIWGP